MSHRLLSTVIFLELEGDRDSGRVLQVWAVVAEFLVAFEKPEIAEAK